MKVRMNWAAWGPTIVALVTAIFTAGALVNRVRNHDTRLDHHDEKLEEHGTKITRMEAWREGYNAATVRHKEAQ